MHFFKYQYVMIKMSKQIQIIELKVNKIE